MTAPAAMRIRAVIRRAPFALALLGAACGTDRPEPARGPDSTTAHVPVPADVRPTPALPKRFASIGRAATPEEVHAWNIDVNAEGTGLPPGRGTHAEGAALFAQRCASCHGAHGEGAGPVPRLIGRDPREGFPFGQSLAHQKTIGNYWPYATTVFDYVQRAMPLSAPGSLRPNEVYSLAAFLLAENEIIGRDAVMTERTLPRVRMPARDRFVVDDRHGGAGFK